MGSFFTNLQIHSATASAVCEAVSRLIGGRAYVSPSTNGWVTVYAESTEDQNTEKLCRFAQEFSDALKTDVFAFLVHDSDIAAYWLYRGGELMDEFNSAPEYFDADLDDAARARMRGSSEALLPLCVAGTTRQQLEAVLHPQGGHALMAEETLSELAPLLGIDPLRIALGFEYFHRDDEELLPDASEFEPVGEQTPRKGTPQTAATIPGPVWSPRFDSYPMAIGLLTRPWNEQFEEQVQLATRFGGNPQEISRRLRDGFDRGACDLLNRSHGLGLPTLEELQTARAEGPDALATLIAHRTPAQLTDVGVAAVAGGVERFVVALLKVGFKPNIPNSSGRTALETAAIQGLNSSMYQLLLRSAAAADGSEPGN